MNKPKISVITPTNRKGGLTILNDCLKKQTFTDWEWVITSPLDLSIRASERLTILKDPSKTTKFWPLNQIYNHLLRHTSGELIVSYQDFIWIPPDALEKLWYHYQTNRRSCITGVGDIYKRLNPDVKVWEDPRKSARVKQGLTCYECYPNDLEFNFSSIPAKGWEDIGGADEYLDVLGYDPVNLNVSFRLNMANYNFMLDQSLEVKGLKHEAHPIDWDANCTFFNGEYDKRKQFYLESGFRLCYYK